MFRNAAGAACSHSTASTRVQPGRHPLGTRERRSPEGQLLVHRITFESSTPNKVQKLYTLLYQQLNQIRRINTLLSSLSALP